MLNREAGGRAAPVPSLSEVVPMSTYEELQLVVSVALLIVAILTYTHKKIAVLNFGESDGYF